MRNRMPYPYARPEGGRGARGSGQTGRRGGSRSTEDVLLSRLLACGRFLRNHTEGRGGQRRILSVLQDHGKITQRELMEILGIQSGSLSEILGKIEGNGWIERTQNNEDKRNIDVSITQEGLAARKELDARHSVDAKALFADLDQQEIEELSGLIDKLLGSLRNSSKGKSPGEPVRPTGTNSEEEV